MSYVQNGESSDRVTVRTLELGAGDSEVLDFFARLVVDPFDGEVDASIDWAD